MVAWQTLLITIVGPDASLAQIINNNLCTNSNLAQITNNNCPDSSLAQMTNIDFLS